MANRTYVILGATGHIGHVIVQKLLKRGHTVKAVGREGKKLKFLENQGAEVLSLHEFNQTTAASLVNFCKGVDAIFSFIPPAYEVENYTLFQNKCGEAIIAAIQKNHIPYVVNLSSLGADLPKGTGPIIGLHDLEVKLNALSGVQVLHLRPSYFMENFLWYIPVIKQAGVLGGALREDLPIACVATQDIGLKAFEFLDQLNFKGHTIFDFVGPEELTLEQVAGILGKAIGKPGLKYVNYPYPEVEKGLVSSGLNPKSARLMIDMYRLINEEQIVPTQKIAPANRGKTTLQEFSKSFAEVYNGSREAAEVLFL